MQSVLWLPLSSACQENCTSRFTPVSSAPIKDTEFLRVFSEKVSSIATFASYFLLYLTAESFSREVNYRENLELLRENLISYNLFVCSKLNETELGESWGCKIQLSRVKLWEF